MQPKPSAVQPPLDPRFEDIWRDHRPYLLGPAARMLRDAGEGEDIVQEAFSRLSRAGLDDIDDVRGWLAVVVRRLCLDRIGSAHARRELAPASDVMEAVLATRVGLDPDADPADRVTLDDQIQLALAIVLDRLSPAERSAFVLHDVFGFPFAAVADIVGRSATACRQLASRARRAIRSELPPRQDDDHVEPHQILTERFIAACAGGDLDALLAILEPDVVGEATLVDGARLGRNVGADAVASGALRFFGPRSGTTLIPVPARDEPCIVAVGHDGVFAVVTMETSDDRAIRHITSRVKRPR